MAFDVAYLIFIVPALMFLMAFYFLSGRGAFLIAGYNTLPKKEQEKYNQKELTRSVGIFLIIFSVLMALTLFAGIILENSLWMAAGIICSLIFTGVWMYHVNTSKKIKSK